MPLFTSVFIIATLYAFMASGTTPVIAASDADSAVAALMVFPLIACSTMVARIGAGATAPRAILASVSRKLVGMSALDGTLKF